MACRYAQGIERFYEKAHFVNPTWRLPRGWRTALSVPFALFSARDSGVENAVVAEFSRSARHGIIASATVGVGTHISTTMLSPEELPGSSVGAMRVGFTRPQVRSDRMGLYTTLYPETRDHQAMNFRGSTNPRNSLFCIGMGARGMGTAERVLASGPSSRDRRSSVHVSHLCYLCLLPVATPAA